MKLLEELMHMDLMEELEFLIEIMDPIERRTKKMVGSTFRKLKSHSVSSSDHSLRVTKYARDFANYLGVDARGVTMGGVTHDVGKIKTPKEILHKPAELDVPERSIMNKHSGQANDFLRDMPGSRGIMARLLSGHHHTKYTEINNMVSTGEITAEQGQAVKILTIADIFDALTCTDRKYKVPDTKFDALEIMKNIPVIDPSLVQKFIAWQYRDFANEYYPDEIIKGREDYELRFGHRRPPEKEHPGYPDIKTPSEVKLNLK